MKLPKFLQTTFWDVSPRMVNTKKNKEFIITRIAEKGTMRGVEWLKKKYGWRAIKEAVKKSKNVSLKTKNFWRVI
ncbi:MAG: hypothetical protein HY981_02100 [Candidatus Magasanikbacteria bacterium]|nr:hypothetical protein [Candidatus Magasanikbacteria bacterium]